MKRIWIIIGVGILRFLAGGLLVKENIHFAQQQYQGTAGMIRYPASTKSTRP